MERVDIQHSLRKISHKFSDGLSEEERQRAVQSFKKVYADEMGKASGQISRRKRVHDKLTELQRQKQIELQGIEEEISERMANFERNRSKQLQSKLKEHKLLDENWKKRWETMVRKRRSSEMLNLERSEQARRETEEFFNKKEFVQTSKSKVGKHDAEDYYFKNSTQKAPFAKRRSASIDHHSFTKHSKLEGLPNIDRRVEGRSELQKFINSSQVSSQTSLGSKRNEIKYNKEKFEVVKKEQEEASLQKMIDKLAKIEKNRMNVLERKQKLVMEAKRMREQRQNPQKIAKNRQRSLDELNLRRRVREAKSRTIQKHSKVNLNESITHHLQAKKQIEESQFRRRQRNYSLKFQKLKQTKIDKLIKEAVVTLKHDTLNRGMA